MGRVLIEVDNNPGTGRRDFRELRIDDRELYPLIDQFDAWVRTIGLRLFDKPTACFRDDNITDKGGASTR